MKDVDLRLNAMLIMTAHLLLPVIGLMESTNVEMFAYRQLVDLMLNAYRLITSGIVHAEQGIRVIHLIFILDVDRNQYLVIQQQIVLVILTVMENHVNVSILL